MLGTYIGHVADLSLGECSTLGGGDLRGGLPDDGRVVLISVTEAGRAACRRATPATSHLSARSTSCGASATICCSIWRRISGRRGWHDALASSRR
jgi:hypothetical protein